MLEAFLEFFIRFVDAVAWPFVVFLLAYTFRRNLQALLNRISRFSYKDLQVEFQENLGAVERKLKPIVITPAPASVALGTSRPTVKIRSANEPVPKEGVLGNAEFKDESIGSAKSVADVRMEIIKELAEISPRLAVIMSWKQIELTTFEVAEAFGIPFQRRRPVTDIVGKLVEHGIIDESFFGVYKPLHNLRNKVFHADDASISQDDAERYVNLALELVSKLRTISEGNHS